MQFSTRFKRLSAQVPIVHVDSVDAAFFHLHAPASSKLKFISSNRQIYFAFRFVDAH